MTQKERQERSRKEIYQAALEEFGTYGYDKVNMERICGNHGISKGMMYHYYSNKDELFLLCVERTFQELRAHVERDMAHLSGEDTAAAVKDFFMIRECFFQLHPQQKLVFVKRHAPSAQTSGRANSGPARTDAALESGIYRGAHRQNAAAAGFEA